MCVTLESSDSFGRPSWAVFGFWCPDPATLEQLLSTGDPIGSACALLGGETPPSAIEIRPVKFAVGPRRRGRATGDPVFHRFDPRSTVREVISLLLGAIQGRTALPNVLGITATSRLAAVARAGFNVVYCHPMDDQTERALARVLSPQETEVEDPWTSPGGPTIPIVGRQPRRTEPRSPAPPMHSEPRSSIFLPWLFWLSIGIVGAVAIFLLAADIRRYARGTSWESSLLIKKEVPLPGEEHSVQAVLDEVKERLSECEELVPEALRQSPGFVAAETLQVIPEYQDRRRRVRQAYSDLIMIRDRMVKRQGNYVAYYYNEAGKNVAPATRLRKIEEILEEAPLGRQDCEVLKEAFGFEFENGDTVVRQWCDSLKRLDKSAVRSLSVSRTYLPLRVRR